MTDSKIEFQATGTQWRFDFYDDISSSKIREIERSLIERAVEFENVYSRFRADSLVSKLSKQTDVWHTFPADGEILFDFYFKLNKLTNGKFTPLVGELLVNAGYDSEYSFEQKSKLETLPNLSDVMKYQFPKVMMKWPYKLDFGAAGKGYLIDILSGLLQELEVFEYCIDAGGDILQKSKSKVLRVGLENPNNFEQVIGVTEVGNQSLCGSSGSRRQWTNFHHILDIDTLKSPTEILATWVIAGSAMVADGLATSLFFFKPESLRDEFSFEYLILNSDFSINRSSSFPIELF